MKKVLLLVLSFVPLLSGAQGVLVGDMDGDNQLTISDVTALTNTILHKSEEKRTYSMDAFILENKLTGKFTVNGIEKNYVDGILDPYNGHDYVDLGLSVMWATCNVGTTNSYARGNFYAWGENEKKTNYWWDTYSHYNSATDKVTKYCTQSSFGDPDYLVHLLETDDAAAKAWGGNWRIPTREEQDELINNCYWVHVSSYSGSSSSGYVVYKAKKTTDKGVHSTSASSLYTLSDPHIFLPEAGYKSGTSTTGGSTRSYYWSRSLYEQSPDSAYCMSTYSGNIATRPFVRSCGLTIRAVCK